MSAVVDRAVEEARHAPHKVFPRHWTFLFGEIAMFAFLVLIGTGLYLAWFYEASGETVVYEGSHGPLAGVEVSRSYESVIDITFDRPAGALVRQTHHWAANVFIAALVVHAARIFFTGAFRRPRRLNWTIGLTLLGLAMASGFFGLALPHDLLGGTGARIGHAFAVSIPIIGPGVADLLFAGEFGNPQMLHRFWLMHVIVLPVMLLGLFGAHMALVWLQTHTQYPGGGRREDNVVGDAAWPAYLFKATGLFASVLGVLVVLGAFVQIAPIWLYGPFEPGSATVPAQPDWYLGWVEGALRILPALDVEVLGYEIPSPFFAGIALPVAVVAVLFAWPFAEARLTGDREPHNLLDRPRDRPVRTTLGVAGLTFLGVLLLGGSHDLQGYLVGVPVDDVTAFYRIVLVVAPPVAGVVAYAFCRSLTSSEHDDLGQPRSGDERRRIPATDEELS